MIGDRKGMCENVDTPESLENWYIEVLGDADHDSGLSFLISLRFLISISFLITIIPITISPTPALPKILKGE